MRDALENITLLQKRMNELQLENQILKGILERSGISYINELKKYQYQEKTGLWEENQGGRIIHPSCILSNRHYEIQEVLKMVRRIAGGRRIPVIPFWMAHLAAPLMQWHARRRKERPLYTDYSLYALKSNDKFSHDKAVRDLGYQPRDLYETLKDTVRWQKKNRG